MIAKVHLAPPPWPWGGGGVVSKCKLKMTYDTLTLVICRSSLACSDILVLPHWQLAPTLVTRPSSLVGVGKLHNPSDVSEEEENPMEEFPTTASKGAMGEILRNPRSTYLVLERFCATLHWCSLYYTGGTLCSVSPTHTQTCNTCIPHVGQLIMALHMLQKYMHLTFYMVVCAKTSKVFGFIFNISTSLGSGAKNGYEKVSWHYEKALSIKNVWPSPWPRIVHGTIFQKHTTSLPFNLTKQGALLSLVSNIQTTVCGTVTTSWLAAI